MAVKILGKAGGVRNPDTHEIPKKSLAQKGQRLADAVDDVVPDADIKSSVSFLQVLQRSETPKDKAVALLKQAAEKSHSGALKKLAVQIQAFDGPFDKIKQMIQKMIFQLQAEQKDEDDHKNWCDLELQTNNDKNEDLETYMKEETELRQENKEEIELTIKDAVA